MSSIFLENKFSLRAITPNLITMFAACCGIISITLSAKEEWNSALAAIIIAGLLDGVDGRVARALNATSKIGQELDSLADFVNFGVAPGMFMYYWLPAVSPINSGAIGKTVLMAAVLFYAMCDAFRLARFNSLIDVKTKPYWKHFFLGLPAPGGAGALITPALLWIGTRMQHDWLANVWFGSAVLVIFGLLMASRLPTISAKSVRIPRNFVIPATAFVVAVIYCAVTKFWFTFAVIGVCYIIAIPISIAAFVRAKMRFESRTEQK